MSSPNPSGGRSGGRILVDALAAQKVKHVFCVPGESYLAALDALQDAPGIRTVVCRQEGGAAMMAEASAKLTGQPGVCFVTRGPGATNAASGIHVSAQDSAPVVLLLGQDSRCYGVSCGPDEEGHAWHAFEAERRAWNVEQSLLEMLRW